MTTHLITIDYSWSKATHVTMKEAYQDYKKLLLTQGYSVGRVLSRTILRGSGKSPKIKKLSLAVELM
jgi:hypothetical protein